MAAALLNLTGLGLGYLYLHRWVRWGIHLVVTIGLFVAAYLTGAASRPWLWLAILGAWLLWMAMDGGLQATWLRRAAPGRPSSRRWLPWAIGVTSVALVAGGVGAYLSFGQREFDKGMAAYRAGDCRPAIQSLHLVGYGAREPALRHLQRQRHRRDRALPIHRGAHPGAPA